MKTQGILVVTKKERIFNQNDRFRMAFQAWVRQVELMRKNEQVQDARTPVGGERLLRTLRDDMLAMRIGDSAT